MTASRDRPPNGDFISSPVADILRFMDHHNLAYLKHRHGDALIVVARGDLVIDSLDLAIDLWDADEQVSRGEY